MYEENEDLKAELMHYGKLGMKWGHHKAEQEVYRQKAAMVANNKNANSSDRKRAKYAAQPAGKRIAKTAASLTVQMVIGDVLTGKIGQYQNMSKADIAKKVAKIAASTASNVAINDALAKSAMKNYNDKGQTAKGSKRTNKIMTKEDAIELGIGVGVKAAQVGAAVGTIKLSRAMQDKKANEARFAAWGKNILPQSVDNVIWTNGDMAVIDNRRR